MTIEQIMLSDFGIIYFISDIGNVWVRIGKTKNLLNLYERFRKHQSGSPIQLKLEGILLNDNYHKLDKQLRQQFNMYHSHSDWFVYGKEIKNYVTENCLVISYNNTYFPERLKSELY